MRAAPERIAARERAGDFAVLLVSPFPLLPPVHGGRVRTLGLARGLARAGAAVDVLAPWVPGTPRATLLEPGLRLHTHRMLGNVLPVLFPKRVAPALALLSLQPRSPFGSRRWLSRFAGCDVMQFEFCGQFHWATLAPPSTAVVYSAHNVERDYHGADPEPQLLRAPALRRIEHLERVAVRSSDIVVTCSDADIQRLTSLYGAPHESAVVANGFDAEILAFRRAEMRDRARAALGFAAADRVILFVGGDAAHNREAVRFLAHDVLPALGSAARLLIVGRCGRAAPRGHPQIRHLGYVEDLRPSFAATDVAVNPVDFGSGTSIKLIEYVAAGLPTISTPIGLRGVPHLTGVVRSASRQLFAEALMASPPEPSPDRGALAVWTWDALAQQLLDRYRQLRPRSGKASAATENRNGGILGRTRRAEQHPSWHGESCVK